MDTALNQSNSKNACFENTNNLCELRIDDRECPDELRKPRLTHKRILAGVSALAASVPTDTTAAPVASVTAVSVTTAATAARVASVTAASVTTVWGNSSSALISKLGQNRVKDPIIIQPFVPESLRHDLILQNAQHLRFYEFLCEIVYPCFELAIIPYFQTNQLLFCLRL